MPRLYLIAIIFLFGCASNEKNNLQYLDFSAHIDSNYNKLEIYCYCFAEGIDTSQNSQNNEKIFSSCTTTIPVSPNSIISKGNLFKSINDLDTIKYIKKIVFGASQKNEPFKGNLDSRLLFLFKTEHSHYDTLVLSRNQWCYNRKICLDYPFNILDSIRSVLKIPIIGCVKKI